VVGARAGDEPVREAERAGAADQALGGLPADPEALRRVQRLGDPEAQPVEPPALGERGLPVDVRGDFLGRAGALEGVVDLRVAREHDDARRGVRRERHGRRFLLSHRVGQGRDSRNGRTRIDDKC